MDDRTYIEPSEEKTNIYREVNSTFKMRTVTCYVYLKLQYGAETGTIDKELENRTQNLET